MGRGGKHKQSKGSPGELLVCRAPRASKRLDIEERLEAGLLLTGSEVKSLRARRADIDGAFVRIVGDEAWLFDMHIAPYEQAGVFGHEPKRPRKLLLKRREIERLRGRLSQKGMAALPTRVYFRGGWAKVELGIGRGRKVVDRRADKEQERLRREAREAMLRRKR